MFVRPLDVLKPLRSIIGEELVSRRAWRRVLDISAQMPGAHAAQYLECRLGADDERVDYQVVARMPAAADLLARIARTARKGKKLGGDRIARFAAHLRRDAALRRFVPSSGLEFDLPEDRSPGPPQVWFSVHPPHFRDLEQQAPPPASRAFVTPVARALATLGEGFDDRATATTLSRWFRALPRRARVLYVAGLLGRSAPGPRFVPELPIPSIRPYLQRIGWRGDPDAIGVVTPLCQTEGNSVKIDVDLNDSAAPKFGAFAEYTHTNAMTQNDSYAMTAPLLDALVDRGLCTRRKRNALVRWPSRVRIPVRGFGWPLSIWLHLDFKVVAWPGGRLEAKAYLGMMPRFALF